MFLSQGNNLWPSLNILYHKEPQVIPLATHVVCQNGDFTMAALFDLLDFL